MSLLKGLFVYGIVYIWTINIVFLRASGHGKKACFGIPVTIILLSTAPVSVT